MAIYQIPSIKTRTMQDSINAMADVFESNVNALTDFMVNRGLLDSGLSPIKVSKQNLIRLMDITVIPQMHSWEVGWTDNPNDPNNPSMKGVTLQYFLRAYDSIFKTSAVPAVLQAANNWDTLYPSWKLQPELSKVLLSLICGRPKLGALFIYHTFCAQESRYPIAVMSEDPWLGFLIGQSVWSSGLNTFEPYYADFNAVATKFGWNGIVGSWIPFIASLGSRTTQFALECFASKYNYIRKLSKPEGPYAKYRNAWLDRMVLSDQSDLMMIVRIGESFCYNTKQIYELTQAESSHLMSKGDGYRQMTLVIPD